MNMKIDYRGEKLKEIPKIYNTGNHKNIMI